MVRVLAGVRWMFRVTGKVRASVIVLEVVRSRERHVERKMLIRVDNPYSKLGL